MTTPERIRIHEMHFEMYKILIADHRLSPNALAESPEEMQKVLKRAGTLVEAFLREHLGSSADCGCPLCAKSSQRYDWLCKLEQPIS